VLKIELGAAQWMRKLTKIRESFNSRLPIQAPLSNRTVEKITKNGQELLLKVSLTLTSNFIPIVRRQ